MQVGGCTSWFGKAAHYFGLAWASLSIPVASPISYLTSTMQHTARALADWAGCNSKSYMKVRCCMACQGCWPHLRIIHKIDEGVVT